MKTASPRFCTKVQGSTPAQKYPTSKFYELEQGKPTKSKQAALNKKLTELLLQLPFMIKSQVESLIMNRVANLCKIYEVTHHDIKSNQSEYHNKELNLKTQVITKTFTFND